MAGKTKKPTTKKRPQVPKPQPRTESTAAAPTKDTIYFHETDMGLVISDVCEEARITKQEFYWYALNLALVAYGKDPIDKPPDKRRKIVE